MKIEPGNESADGIQAKENEKNYKGSMKQKPPCSGSLDVVASLAPQLCPGCGLGPVVFALLDACCFAGLETDRLKWIVGTGCLHPVGRKLKKIFSVEEVENGRLGEALGQELLERPSPPEASGIVVLMNNLDLFLSGAEDWLTLFESLGLTTGRTEKPTAAASLPPTAPSLARSDQRGLNVLPGSFSSLTSVVVIHFNNCLYINRESGVTAATPLRRPSEAGEDDLPFNLPQLFARWQPVLLARWTPLQAGWLRETLKKALISPGFSFIEVVNPCVVWEVEENRCLSAAERMAFYDHWTTFYSGESLAALDLRGGRIIVGEMVNHRSFLDEPRKKNLVSDAEGREGRSEIHLEIEKCQGCGICLELCQVGVFAWSEVRNQRGYPYPLVLHPEKCLNCGLCEMFCPELAVRVEWQVMAQEKEPRP